MMKGLCVEGFGFDQAMATAIGKNHFFLKYILASFQL